MAAERPAATEQRRDRRLVIALDQVNDYWIVDVAIDGQWVGDGTAPTVGGALDIASSILYGDPDDHLNGDQGAISALE